MFVKLPLFPTSLDLLNHEGCVWKCVQSNRKHFRKGFKIILYIYSKKISCIHRPQSRNGVRKNACYYGELFSCAIAVHQGLNEKKKGYVLVESRRTRPAEGYRTKNIANTNLEMKGDQPNILPAESIKSCKPLQHCFCLLDPGSDYVRSLTKAAAMNSLKQVL